MAMSYPNELSSRAQRLRGAGKSRDLPSLPARKDDRDGNSRSLDKSSLALRARKGAADDRVDLPSRRRHLGSLWNRAGHSGNASTGSLRSAGSGGLRLWGCGSWCTCRNQSQMLAHFHFQFGESFTIVLQKLAGILAALSDALALVAVPCTGFLQQVVVHRQVKQVAFPRDSFTV